VAKKICEDPHSFYAKLLTDKQINRQTNAGHYITDIRKNSIKMATYKEVQIYGIAKRIARYNLELMICMVMVREALRPGSESESKR